MTIFDDRERAAERQLEREQDLAFRIRVRRNKLLGLWAAGHMGLIGDAAARYAASIVDVEIAGHDDRPIIVKVRDDLVTSGNRVAEEHIRRQLAVLGARARAQIMAVSAPGGAQAERR
jgi:hypothetical protein